MIIDAAKQTNEDKTDQKQCEDDTHDDLDVEHEDDTLSVTRNAKKTTTLEDDEVMAQVIILKAAIAWFLTMENWKLNCKKN